MILEVQKYYEGFILHLDLVKKVRCLMVVCKECFVYTVRRNAVSEDGLKLIWELFDIDQEICARLLKGVSREKSHSSFEGVVLFSCKKEVRAGKE